jgi:hypothetical protein
MVDGISKPPRKTLEKDMTINRQPKRKTYPGVFGVYSISRISRLNVWRGAIRVFYSLLNGHADFDLEGRAAAAIVFLHRKYIRIRAPIAGRRIEDDHMLILVRERCHVTAGTSPYAVENGRAGVQGFA